MRLRCPTCQSVLEVPDGTQALVRCPTCRQVFDPSAPEPGRVTSAAGVVATPPAAPPRPLSPPTQRRGTPAGPAHAPRKPPASTAPAPEPLPLPSAVDERDARLRKEREKTKNLKRRLRIAGYGCLLLHRSYVLYELSLLLMMVFHILGHAIAGDPLPPLVAGVLGFLNFILGAAALGVILSGPDREQLRVYATLALIFAILHLGLLAGVVTRTGEVRMADERLGGSPMAGFYDAPTQLQSLASYLTFIIYPELSTVPKSGSRLPVALMIMTGFAEILRLMFAMLALSSLARIAGDRVIMYRCLKAAASPFYVLAWIFFGMLGGIGLIMETGMNNDFFGQVLIFILSLSSYAALAFMILIPLRRANEVMWLCFEPILLDEKYRTD